ncbi:AraC family transcriptional regulator [Mesorhizobium sp. 128a]
MEMANSNAKSQDRMRTWLEPDLGDTLFLQADYREQIFDQHFHEEFAIGIIESGCQKFSYDGRRRLDMTGGTIALISPGVVHSAEPADGGWRYRMLYPARSVVERLLEGTLTQEASTTFHAPSLVDDDLYVRLERMHRLSQSRTAGPLELEAYLLDILIRAFTRHAGIRTPSRPSHHRVGLARARDYLIDQLATQVTLEQVATISGLSKYEFIRQFRKVFGLPPHAYLRLARVWRASDLIRRGTPLADSAFAAGFADQAHMNRVFRRTLGYTPGMLDRARDAACSVPDDVGFNRGNDHARGLGVYAASV